MNNRKRNHNMKEGVEFRKMNNSHASFGVAGSSSVFLFQK